MKKGFTLIEMSIVLVIIGLVIGSVAVGRDLVKAAEIRAQITQLDKFNSAANVFNAKYGSLPGDMSPANASKFGFFTRTGATGDGDNNGYIAGMPISTDVSPYYSLYFTLGGETVLFWTDLSAAGLIEGGFTDSSDALLNINTDSQYAAELPRAKIGSKNFIYVNGYYASIAANTVRLTGSGFQIISLSKVGAPAVAGAIFVNPGITPQDAYNMDKKVDDGMPLTGTVVAMYPDTVFAGNLQPGEQAAVGFPMNCVSSSSPYPYNVGVAGVSDIFNCSVRFQTAW